LKILQEDEQKLNIEKETNLKNTNELNDKLTLFIEKRSKIDNILIQMKIMGETKLDDEYDINNKESLDKISALLDCSKNLGTSLVDYVN
jgi:hypothetical protein